MTQIILKKRAKWGINRLQKASRMEPNIQILKNFEIQAVSLPTFPSITIITFDLAIQDSSDTTIIKFEF